MRVVCRRARARVPTGASMQSAMNIHCDVIFGSGRESISDFVPTFSRSRSYTTQNSLFYTINANTSNALPTIIPYYYFWDDGDVSGNLRARILE